MDKENYLLSCHPLAKSVVMGPPEGRGRRHLKVTLQNQPRGDAGTFPNLYASWMLFTEHRRESVWSGSISECGPEAWEPGVVLCSVNDVPEVAFATVSLGLFPLVSYKPLILDELPLHIPSKFSAQLSFIIKKNDWHNISERKWVLETRWLNPHCIGLFHW